MKLRRFEPYIYNENKLTVKKKMWGHIKFYVKEVIYDKYVEILKNLGEYQILQACISGPKGTVTVNDTISGNCHPPSPGTMQVADWNPPTVFLWKEPICLSQNLGLGHMLPVWLPSRGLCRWAQGTEAYGGHIFALPLPPSRFSCCCPERNLYTHLAWLLWLPARRHS